MIFSLELEGGGRTLLPKTFAIKSWLWWEGVWTSLAELGVNNDLKLLLISKNNGFSWKSNINPTKYLLKFYS